LWRGIAAKGVTLGVLFASIGEIGLLLAGLMESSTPREMNCPRAQSSTRSGFSTLQDFDDLVRITEVTLKVYI
jgi:hypothetical protein